MPAAFAAQRSRENSHVLPTSHIVADGLEDFGAVCLAAAAAISLAGCGTDYVTPASMMMDDYHDRHPIVLAQAPTTLDIFPVGEGKLDEGSVADIRAFAARYRTMGNGRIVILSPSVGGYRTHAAVDEIRRVLASTGLRGYRSASVPIPSPMPRSPRRSG